MAEEKLNGMEQEDGDWAPEVVELVDEDGNTVRMCVVDVVPLDGAEYAALVEEDVWSSDEAEADITFMCIEQGENEEDAALIPVEDEALLDRLFEAFLASMEEMEEE